MDRDEIPDHGPEVEAVESDDENAGVRDETADDAPVNNARHEEEEGTDGEDLLDDNMWNDYRQMPELDQYEREGIASDADVESLSENAANDARLAAERDLERRDRREAGDLPAAFQSDDEEASLGGDARQRRRAATKARLRAPVDTGSDVQQESIDTEDAPVVLDASNAHGHLADWVQQDNVTRAIRSQFEAFLHTYVDEVNDPNKKVYVDRISDMVQANTASLEIDFVQLSRHATALAIWTVDAPTQMLSIFNESAARVVARYFPKYLENVHSEIFVRVTGLPVVEHLRDIRHAHLNTLVKVAGVVTRRTGVYPQMAVMYFSCRACGGQIGPLVQTGDATSEVKPASCPNCESKGPFVIDQQHTQYRNYQKITLQESPGTVPPGRLPRSKNVILLNDLIDYVRPGEEVEVTGIYQHGYDSSLNAQAGFPVFATFLEANHMRCKSDANSLDSLTEDAIQAVQRLGRDPHVGERIIDSIAPSIFGHRDIKACIALALFGGQEKHVGSHRLRGDINVLLIGDPGTAKSQFLKYAEATASRAVYTTGKGASAVGLTATVTKDPITREWTLEGGALVLADRGVCLIDEFDKMNENDRVSIHEAMEQQSISISKAGIVTGLRARCAVLAAANPDNGRYDPSRTFNENVRTLSDPIISRFDCLCVVKDQVDAQMDERLASFVVDSHHRSHPANEIDELEAAAAGEAGDPDPARPWQAANAIDQDTLKTYIAYAKKHCHPKLQDADTAKMVQVYTELRREAGMTHAMPVAVRHLESMVRMSEAHARMHLRDKVIPADIDVAIRLMLESFVQAQKFSIQKQLRKRFQRFMVSNSDYNNLLLTVLRGMARESDRLDALTRGDGGDGGYEAPTEVSIDKGRFEERAQDYNVRGVVEQFYVSALFRENGFRMDAATGNIIQTR